MKKILFTIYSYSLGGGAEKILSNVVNGLAEKTDYEISVLQYADFGVKTEKTDDRVKILKPVVDMNNSSKVEKIFKYFLVHFCPFILRKRYIKENGLQFVDEYVYNVGKAGEMSENIEKFCSMGKRNAIRLSGIINDLLDISKIEALLNWSSKIPQLSPSLSFRIIFWFLICGVSDVEK